MPYLPYCFTIAVTPAFFLPDVALTNDVRVIYKFKDLSGNAADCIISILIEGKYSTISVSYPLLEMVMHITGGILQRDLIL